jgi:hypothetical protein
MIHLFIPYRINWRSRTILLFSVPKKFVELHFGQERGREHSIVLLGDNTFLSREERAKVAFKPAFDFT